jgi:hypothetical protein
MSLNAGSTVGLSGIVYAPSALLSVSGSAQLKVGVIANQLLLSGNGGSTLTTSDAAGSVSATAGQLLGSDLSVYVDQSVNPLGADEAARVQETLNGLSQLLSPYSVQVALVTDPALATVVVEQVSTTSLGGQAAGVLATFDQNDTGGVINLVTGWNWYAQADPLGIGANQYDFETVLLHELGHALGLGHGTDPASVMFATLSPGLAKRDLTTTDLQIPTVDSGTHALMASLAPGASGTLIANLTSLSSIVATLPQSTSSTGSAGTGTGMGAAANAVTTPVGPAGRFRPSSIQRGVPQNHATRNLGGLASDAGYPAPRPRPAWDIPLDFFVPTEPTDAPGRASASAPAANDCPEERRPVDAGRSPADLPISPEGEVVPATSLIGEPDESPTLAGVALLLALPGATRWVRRRWERYSALGTHDDVRSIGKHRRF